MEASSQALWNFFALAYRRGLIDDLMVTLGRVMDPDAELGDFLSQLEDGLADADFGPFETLWQDTMHPVLVSLTTDDAIDTLRALLKVVRPLVDTAAENRTAINGIAQEFKALKPRLGALKPAITTLAGSLSAQALGAAPGVKAGVTLNRAFGALTQTHDRKPELVSRFFADLKRTVDPRLVRRATDIALGGFLDQRPRLMSWTVGTIATRFKKRLGR